VAGDWIKMRADLRRHPKVVRMASALGADKFRVIGGLHAVWSLFDEQTEDGLLEGYSPKALDEEIAWPGFADAMQDIGWLEYDPEYGLFAPEFDEHNGQSAKRRAQETKRKRKERAAESGPHGDESLSASDADKKRTKSGLDKREESSSLRSEDTAEFELAWQAYPKRPGASKAGSLKAWRARRKAGAAADEMLAGVQRYAAFCAASKTEPRFIKQPATFFGPDEHFRSDWTFTPFAQRTAGAPHKHSAAAAAIFDMDEPGVFNA
jgi:hypothetical protein